MIDFLMHRGKALLLPSRYAPELGSSPAGGPWDSAFTFLVVCGAGFKANIPNAASTYRLGLARGFARLGIGYRLVSVLNLAEELAQTAHPIVFLSEYEYEMMSYAAVRALRRVPHFVWIAPPRASMAIAYAPHGVKAKEIRLPAPYATRRMLSAEPSFLFTVSPPSAFDIFVDYGVPMVSLPQACDDQRYFPEPGNAKYADVEMAFVGGYWRNKAFQFDKYLKPYADKLTIFGHSPWPAPYTGYGGLLPDNDERVLYQNARLCPAISEPHAEVTGDIVERVFKVAGSGGVAVTDAVRHYHDIFSTEELLIADSVEHYNELVWRALTDNDFNEKYRKAGIKAIRERHTYVHRARKVLELLKIPVPADADVPQLVTDLTSQRTSVP